MPLSLKLDKCLYGKVANGESKISGDLGKTLNLCQFISKLYLLRLCLESIVLVRGLLERPTKCLQLMSGKQKDTS